MAVEIPKNSTPYAVADLPFANESQLQRFVEDHADEIFGLTVVASARRGGRRLFDIDMLAVDSDNVPFVIECKWDIVDAGALRQLAAYSRALQRGWAVFEERVRSIRGRRVRIKKRQPVLVVIGYRFDPVAITDSAPIVCVSYAYHGVTFTRGIVEQRGPGKVSLQRASDEALALDPHPAVSKKYATHERLSAVPSGLRAAFWRIDAALRELEGVRVTYGGKNFVRYRDSRGRFAEATVCRTSIEWRFSAPGAWGHSGQTNRVDMVTAADEEKVVVRLRRAYQQAG